MMAKIIKCATILMYAFGITILIKGIASEDFLQVLVNGSAVINCFPNHVLSVQWHHTPPGKSSSIYIYAGGNFYSPYNTGRLRVDSNSTTNIYTLFITNVTYEDAGLYECKDDIRSGVFGSTELIVLNSSPVCNSNMHPDGFIGPNKCDLQMENMTFSCALSFAGKTPSLMWRSLNDSQHQLIDSVCTSQSNHIGCSFTLKADPEYDGSVFTCETKASKGVGFNCSTEVIKVQYFSADNETLARKVRDNVSCIARSNLETRYNWTIEKSGQYVFLSSRRTIVMQEPGIYRCDVEYSIRNNTCSFLTSVVNASVDSTNEEVVTGSSAGGNVVAAITVPIIVILVILIAILVVVVSILRKRKMKRERERESIPLVPVPTQRDDIKSKLEAQREKLVDIVESEFELLPVLLGNGALTVNEKDSVKTESTNALRNRMLLGCIFRKAKHREFLEALRITRQMHVVNWIEANGIYEPECGLQWPLTVKEVEHIERNYRYLSEVLSTDDAFVDVLFESNAISRRQKNFIDAKTNSFERNEAFFDILRRSSLRAYFLVTECLRASKQELIADILEDGRAIVPLHANLDGQNTKETEGKLVELMKADLRKAKIIKMNGYFIVDVRQGNSIVLFTCCRKSEDFDQLCSEVAGDHIRDIMGQLFNRLRQDSPTTVISVTIHDEEKESIRSSFERDEARDKKFDAQIKKLRSELQNKSVSRESLSKSDSNYLLRASDEYINMTPQKEVKKEHVTDITESNWREILRSNYADLLVKIDSNSEGGLKGEFKKLGLFTPGQINNIWGYRSSIDRNKAILSLLEKGDLERFLAVRSALEKSGQRPTVKQHLSLIKEHLSAPNDKYKEPLKGSYRYQMLVNWNNLLDNIGDVEGLIILITERGTLTDYQKAVLEDLSHRPSKLNYLLRLLETGSQQHFDDFCDCLIKNNQDHIVNDYLTPKSINKNLDDIPKSFKDMKLCFSVKTRPIRGRVLVISNRRYMDQNRSEMHGNETNLNIFFEEKLIFQKKPIFDGKLMTNETVQGIRTTSGTEQQSSKDYDLFLMFLFSYGNSREICTTDGQSLKIDDLFEMFDDKNCPKLGGKPKLFIIQTFERDDERDDSPSLDAKGKLSVKFNLKDDMAVVYTTVKGEPENGREETGTLFTRCLLEVFFDKIEANFEEIIKKVLELLRERVQEITLANGKAQTVQQLTTFQTTLKQEVFLVEQR